MLSDSLDPDQDLQSGSKLVTWYDVCCNIRGGGLCPSCKIQRGGGGLCPSCKIQWGGLCPSCKIHGGDFVHVYKKEQEGFCPGGGGGIMSVSRARNGSRITPGLTRMTPCPTADLNECKR